MSDKPSDSEVTKLNRALDWAYGRAHDGIPGEPGAEIFADDYLGSHADAEAAIDALIRWQCVKAGTAGFVTGIGGLPTLPIAIPLNLAAVLYLQLRMIEAIAHMRGHDLKSDKVKTLALVSLVGSGGIELLKKAGINVGSKLTAQAIQKIPRALIVTLNRAVGFRLLTKAGTKGTINFSRVIPVVGGLVSGAIDVGATRAIGAAAKSIFPPIRSDKPAAMSDMK
jgi:hypothetical protein